MRTNEYANIKVINMTKYSVTAFINALAFSIFNQPLSIGNESIQVDIAGTIDHMNPDENAQAVDRMRAADAQCQYEIVTDSNSDRVPDRLEIEVTFDGMFCEGFGFSALESDKENFGFDTDPPIHTVIILGEPGMPYEYKHKLIELKEVCATRGIPMLRAVNCKDPKLLKTSARDYLLKNNEDTCFGSICWYNINGFDTNGNLLPEEMATPCGFHDIFMETAELSCNYIKTNVESYMRNSEKVLARRASDYERGSPRRERERMMARQNYSNFASCLIPAENMLDVTKKWRKKREGKNGY